MECYNYVPGVGTGTYVVPEARGPQTAASNAPPSRRPGAHHPRVGRVAGVPWPWLNRVIGRGEAKAGLVAGLRTWFGDVAPRFETTPDSMGPALGQALVAAGLVPGEGDTLVWGAGREGAMPDRVSPGGGAARAELSLIHLRALSRTTR